MLGKIFHWRKFNSESQATWKSTIRETDRARSQRAPNGSRIKSYRFSILLQSVITNDSYEKKKRIVAVEQIFLRILTETSRCFPAGHTIYWIVCIAMV